MKSYSSAPDLDGEQRSVPRHIAIIMDGNNRWAKRQGLQGAEGHKEGARAVRATVENCARLGIEVLTVYAFSSENWRRPEAEVAALMNLFLEALADEVPDLHKNGIRLRFIGDLSAFSQELQTKMQAAVRLTESNPGMVFAVAVNYGGHWDITHACKQLAELVQQGRLAPESISAEMLQSHISLGDLPPPDLCIRTGGEQRVSNFLLWQIAYAEFYFTELLWPDFDQSALEQAIADYNGRQRRFGRTSEQVEASQ